jgi:hypothetical protein
MWISKLTYILERLDIYLWSECVPIGPGEQVLEGEYR